MADKTKRRIRAAMTKTGLTYQAVHNLRGSQPPTEFEALVRRVIVLAEARALEDEERSRARNGAFSFADLRGPRPPARQALFEALDARNHDEVRRLEALMYAGRDCLYGEGVTDIEEYATLARTLPADSREVMISMIMQKRPLADYLTAGLEMARKIGLDLEHPLPGYAARRM